MFIFILCAASGKTHAKLLAHSGMIVKMCVKSNLKRIMKKMKNLPTWLFTILRIIVGWLMLYEGISKLLTPGWTAKYYMMGSTWILSDFLNWMASSPSAMRIVDFMNIWGLTIIGLSLFIGLFVRWSSIAGSILLLFYFAAYPPIPGYTFGVVTEGSYLWVDKTFILFFLLLVFSVIKSDFFYGVDRFIKRWKEEKPFKVTSPATDQPTSLIRREFLSNMISLPFFGAFAYALYKKKKWDSFEEKILAIRPDTDARTGATTLSFQFSSLENLKGQLPKGRIGNVDVSRVILGGNLIGGWAHSRDLIYVSKFVRAYHDDERIMRTFQLAERCGINTMLSHYSHGYHINKYNHEIGGNMQYFADCRGEEQIRIAEEYGATAMYPNGDWSDRHVREGKIDEIAKVVEQIRSYGKPAGIGAHRLETVQACVEQGIKPDFWMKTLHHLNYWSAQAIPPRGVYCVNPQETIDFMNSLEEPWIAFKTLGAGAIPPNDGFPYAFNNGADFICVGMFDFQIVDDVNIALDTLSNVDRIRPWRG